MTVLTRLAFANFFFDCNADDEELAHITAPERVRGDAPPIVYFS